MARFVHAERSRQRLTLVFPSGAASKRQCYTAEAQSEVQLQKCDNLS